jgi:glycosyl hydrolase family 38/alpha mannosidase-like protein
MSLVEIVDDVLDALEADERLRFTLDGQLATVDDYLEIRPEAEGRIRSLVRAGRLAIGPWQTLMDEFLVDGETTIRNLEAGQARAAEMGGTMRVGYLPDMFGHCAQMPQILQAAGLHVCVVWRGVPSVVDGHRFLWQGLDGSTVLAEYLPSGYGNAVGIWRQPGVPDLGEFEERYRPWFGDDDILGMVGTDHMPLVDDLPGRIPAGTRLATLAEYLDGAAPTDGLPLCRGELRSAARANLLPGVTSSRIDLKAACGRAERWLERYAEPMQALYGDTWPEPFLKQAWSRMFQNSAHDSICGCSADEVSAQVLVRYAEAEQIGRELATRALARIAEQVPAGGYAVFNPSPWERTEVIDLDGELAQATVPALGWAAVQPGRVPGTVPGTRLETRIVRGKDVGDSYNYAPPDDDVIVDTPRAERSEVLGDHLTVLHRTYEWDGKAVETRTYLEQRIGEPFVRIRLELENPCENQRVRLHVRMKEQADRSFAEGQFAVVERGQEVEGGHGEVPLPTYPASAFVTAGGISLLFEHVTEYELVGDEIAITILRSTGLISRADNPWREENAGPELPIPDCQMRGRWRFQLAYYPSDEGVHEQAERFRHPFLTAKGTGPGGDLKRHEGPALEGDRRVILTAFRKGQARLVNESPEPQAVSFDGEKLDLRPWEIRTLERG